MTTSIESPQEQRDSNGSFKTGNTLGFKPNQSGNPAGRPLNSVTTLLKNTSKKTTEAIAEKIREKALDGDLGFTNLYIDRTDGTVKQDGGVVIDNRTINILVSSEKGKEQLDKLKGGGLPELERMPFNEEVTK